MEKVKIAKRKDEPAKEYTIISINECCPRCGEELKYHSWASWSRGHAIYECCGIEMFILDRASDDEDTEEFKNFMNNIGKTHYIALTELVSEPKSEV